MASSLKSTESKLLAIYKLDFYKKKRNWKLSENVKKELPRSPKITDETNKICNVGEEFPESELEVDQVSPHNIAFLQEATEDPPDIQPPSDEVPVLHQPGSCPEQICYGDKSEMLYENPQQDWCEKEVEDVHGELAYNQPDGPYLQHFWTPEDPPDIQPPSDEVPVHQPGSCPEQICYGDKSEMVYENPQQDWCEKEVEDVHGELAYNQPDGPYLQHFWTPDDLKLLLEVGDQSDCERLQDDINRVVEWSNAAQLEQKPSLDPVGLPDLDYLTAAQMLTAVENWLTQHGYPVKEEYGVTYDECGVEDESADFMRGAHYAPHSTEIDLDVTEECACISDKSPCVLPVRQLVRAIQQHHSALTLLLGEQALRETLSSRSLLQPDSILSGSHRVLPASGHDVAPGPAYRPHQDSRIGIRMGRPYRIKGRDIDE